MKGSSSPFDPTEIAWIVPYIVILVGAVMYYGGYQLRAEQADFLERSQEVSLTVVFLFSKTDEDGSEVFTPVFETVTSEGQTIRYRSKVSTYPPLHKVGDVVPGRYLPETGELASHETLDTSRYLGWGFSIVGGFFAVGGMYLAIRRYLHDLKAG